MMLEMDNTNEIESLAKEFRKLIIDEKQKIDYENNLDVDIFEKIKIRNALKAEVRELKNNRNYLTKAIENNNEYLGSMTSLSATRERLRKKIAAKKQSIFEDNAKRAQIVDEMKKERAMYENKLMSVETAVSNLDTVKALEEEIRKTENEIYEIEKNVEKAEKIHITRNKEIFYERKAEIQGLLRQFRQEEFKLDYSNTQKTKLCKTLVKKKLVETDRKYKEFARDLELPERNLQNEVNRLMLKKKKLVNRLEMMQEQEEMLKKKAEHLKSRHDKSKDGNDEDSIHSSQNTIIASEYEYEDKEIDEFPDDDTIFAELFADAEGKNRVFSVLL